MSRAYSNLSLEENNVNTILDEPRRNKRHFYLGDFNDSNHTLTHGILVKIYCNLLNLQKLQFPGKMSK